MPSDQNAFYTDGFLPNYTKMYVTLAEEPNAAFTFGLVDAKVIMPNSSGSGSALYLWLGLGLIMTAVMFYGLCLLKRRRVKPVRGTHFMD